MRFFFLFLCGACCSLAIEAPQAVVLFLADDLGYHDTSAYGCEAVPCPHLRRLADEGLMFTDAHSSHSVCTPSRFSLLVGKYAWRQKNTRILPGDAKLIVPTKDSGVLTLPALMQRAGYRTAAIGKWHLGLGAGKEPLDWNRPISPGPAEVGFDESFIMAATADRVPCVYLRNGCVVGLDPADPIRVSYKKGFRFGEELTGAEYPELLKPHGRPSDMQHSDTIVNGISRIGHMSGGRSALWRDEDLADTLTEEAVSFIRRHRGERIFLYFCTNDIHVPRDPQARFIGASGLGIRGDVTVQMDDSLGRIRAALAENGFEDTLFIFTSDNGPVIADGYEDGARGACADHNPAAPYSGGKYTLREGGTRVPMVISRPGYVPAGKQSHALVAQMDLGRSLARIVGMEVPDGDMPDAQDMSEAFLGRDAVGRDSLVEAAFNAHNVALRRGSYKYIPGPPELLYNLAQDPAEKHNLAQEQPGTLREMAAQLRALMDDSKF